MNYAGDGIVEEDNSSKLNYHTLLLLPILALAFYFAFIPHHNYPYPVHIDDWIHWANAEAILKAGSVNYIEPILGGRAMDLSINLEVGFQIFWGIFQRISGISWLGIFRYFPAVIFLFTVLAAYVLTNRQGFGLEAAFFTCLILTTVGILGPAFLVPVAMGLLYVPLTLFVAYNYRSIGAYLMVLIFTSFLVVIHAPSAICLVLIILPYVLLNLRGNFKHGLFVFLAVVFPFLVPFPWIFQRLLPTAQTLLVPQTLSEYIDFPRIIISYGYLPTVLCLLGTLVLAWKGGRRNYGLVLGLLALLVMLVVFFSFHYGISIMYERGLMFLMLMVSLNAGAGLMGVRTLKLPAWISVSSRVSSITRYLSLTLCLILVGAVLYIGIPYRQGISYYHMVNDEEYKDFTWIRENVGEKYDKAILDPWKGVPFAAITNRTVYTRIHVSPQPSDYQAKEFLDNGCADTDFLRENGISIVYTDQECSNPDLAQVHERVYLLKE